MLGTLKEIIDMLFLLWQNEINQQVSQIADLQENVKTQQAETTKGRDELKTALTTMEQLKEWFQFWTDQLGYWKSWVAEAGGGRWSSS